MWTFCRVSTHNICWNALALFTLQILRQHKLAQTWFCFRLTPSSDNQTQFWYIYIIFLMRRRDNRVNDSVIESKWIDFLTFQSFSLLLSPLAQTLLFMLAMLSLPCHAFIARIEPSYWPNLPSSSSHQPNPINQARNENIQSFSKTALCAMHQGYGVLFE